jgi:hypothetical protein
MPQPRQRKAVLRQVACHACMGAALGAALSLALLAIPAGPVSAMVAASTAAAETATVILLMLSSNCAVGAGMTGYILLAVEDADRR